MSNSNIIIGSNLNTYNNSDLAKTKSHDNQGITESFNNILKSIGNSYGDRAYSEKLTNSNNNFLEMKSEQNLKFKSTAKPNNHDDKNDTKTSTKKSKDDDSDKAVKKKEDNKKVDSDKSQDDKSVNADEINKKMQDIKDLLNDPSIQNDTQKQDDLLKLLFQLQSLLDKANGSLSSDMLKDIKNVMSNPIINLLSQNNNLLATTVKEIQEKADKISTINLNNNVKIENDDSTKKTEKHEAKTDVSSKENNVNVQSDSKELKDNSHDNDLLNTVQNLIVQQIRFDKSVSGHSAAARSQYDNMSNTVDGSSNSNQGLYANIGSELAQALGELLTQNSVQGLNQNSIKDLSLGVSPELISTLSQMLKQQNGNDEIKNSLGTLKLDNILAKSENSDGNMSTIKFLLESLNGNHQDQNSLLKSIVDHLNLSLNTSSIGMKKASGIVSDDTLAMNTQEVKNAIKNSISEVQFNLSEKSNNLTDNTSGSTLSRPSANSNQLIAKLSSTNQEFTNLALNQVSNNSERLDSKQIIFDNLQNNSSQNLDLDYKDILKQITNSSKLVVTENSSEFSIKLNPENLGKLSLKLVTENGIVSAKFVAENSQVKHIIESNFNELKQSFQEQGLNIGSFSVSVGSHEQGAKEKMYNMAKNSNKKFRNVNAIGEGSENGIDEGIFSSDEVNDYLYPESNVNYMV